VTEILRQHYGDIRRYINYQTAQARAGTLDDAGMQEVRLRSERRFAFGLLNNDYIENLGPLEIDDSPTEDLALRLSRRLSLPLDEAREQVARLENEGLLTPVVVDKHVLWSWTGPSRKEVASPAGVR
jgi:hypothetical protein